MAINKTIDNSQYMNAIGLTYIPEIGGVADAIEMVKVPIVHPKSNEVRIRIKASSLHIDEIYAAQGTSLGRFYGPKSATRDQPHLLGSSISGVIVELGENVTDFTLGDAVIVTPHHLPEQGSWAQFKCVHQDRLIAKPDDMSHVQAAALTMAACVAWGAISYSKATAGQRCLVVGASGSIGSMIVQYLHARGCEVTAVCSQQNVDHVLTLGAGKAIDYQTQQFAQEAKKQGVAYDYIFDCVGGEDIEREAFSALSNKGAFITVVGPVKYIGERRLSLFAVCKIITYVLKRMLMTWFKRPRYIFSAKIPRKTIVAALREATQHQLQIPIERIIPFEINAVKNAVHLLLSHRAKGRIVIDFNKLIK